MGMSGPANANKVARRNRWSGRVGLMSEINVTPFVDVMLVLLIIFMVAAPLLTVGVPVDLPETGAKALETRSTPIIVSVDREGRVHLQETPIPLENIVSKLRSIAATGYEERIFIRGDKSTHYGIVMKVMAEISAAGFKNIGLISLPEKGL